MPAPAEIRPATAADADAVVALLVRQLREHHIDTPEAGVRRGVERLLADPEAGRILVATVDGEPVGVAALSFVWTIEHGGRSAWLEELYVAPTRRMCGIGTLLLRAALAAAAASGAVAVDLEVEAEHARAANLYRREGFRPHARSRFVRTLAPRDT